MHTFTFDQGKKGPLVFHYNSDLSGSVDIINIHGDEMNVDGDALLVFVANYVRDTKIAALEAKEIETIKGALSFLQGALK